MPTGYSQLTSVSSYYGNIVDFFPNINNYPEENG
tara:strand:- start:216 stop:317 length:102 start_codon:yes stop_codon:yes gene_type:complete